MFVLKKILRDFYIDFEKIPLLIEKFFHDFVFVERNLIFVNKLFNYCYIKTKSGQKNDSAIEI